MEHCHNVQLEDKATPSGLRAKLWFKSDLGCSLILSDVFSSLVSLDNVGPRKRGTSYSERSDTYRLLHRTRKLFHSIEDKKEALP